MTPLRRALRASLPGRRPPPDALTSAVLGDPAHIGQQPVDVEMLPVEVGALLVPEVPPLLGAGLRVAGLELHPPPDAVLPTVFGPGEREGTHTLSWNIVLCTSLSLSSPGLAIS